MATDIAKVFSEHMDASKQLLADASGALDTAFSAFTQAGNLTYTPYDWQIASPPFIVYSPSYNEPIRPVRGKEPKEPKLKVYPTIPDIDKSGLPTNKATKPTLNYPREPSGPPNDTTGTVPRMTPLQFPSKPNMYPLPPATLPYLTLDIPDKPTWIDPVFNACPPADITTIPLEEYLQQLKDMFAEYADTIPRLVMSHWLDWYRAMLGENPLIAKIEHILSNYYDTGGAGIPVPIEEAIITRATDRVTVEYQRAQAGVFDSAVRRGLLLPSGTVAAGLKDARQAAAEAVSKVVTDVAIKNLELEQDYMKFMLQLGVEFEKTLLGFAGSLANTVTELNGQAIEMVKQVLAGMLGINDANVKIYIAKWTGYVSAVEAYKVQWQAVEMQIRVYEAEIRAELAKTEIDKAYVEVLVAMVSANKALVDLYKAQIDAETAKVEADRVAILGYQASVQAYVAKIEAYKAQWQGYAAANEGQVAKAKVYEAEVQAFAAEVNAYRAKIEGQAEVVKAKAVNIDAVAKENAGQLQAWSIQLDAVAKAYSGDMEGYKAEWGAVAMKLQGYAEGARIMADSLQKGYALQVQVDIERQHEHLAEWVKQLETAVAAGKGLVALAATNGAVASAALNSLTAFAGEMLSKQS